MANQLTIRRAIGQTTMVLAIFAVCETALAQVARTQVQQQQLQQQQFQQRQLQQRQLQQGRFQQGQFQAPQNAVVVEESGTLEGMQGNLLKFKDSNELVWLLQVNPMTQVNIAGEADFAYLETGMTVELIGKIGTDGTFEEPISEIEVLNTKGRPTLGLFDPTKADEDAKPVRNPKAGEYRVRGRLVGIKGDELTIAAGRLRIAGTAAEDMKVVLDVDDPRLAKVGDEMKIKAWTFETSRPNPMRFGQALAESVDITLANPPATGKRGR